jgi:outer membrane protein TolC
MKPTTRSFISHIRQGFLAGATLSAATLFAEPPDTKRQSITLSEAVEMALANNVDTKIQRLEIKVDEERIRLAWGAFDPSLRFGASADKTETPQNTQEYVSTGGVAGEGRVFEQENYRLQGSLEGRLPLGTRFSIGTIASSLDNTLNREIPPALFNPEYPAYVGIEVRQPLLREFGPAANLAEVRISRANRDVSRIVWEGRVIEAIAGVWTTYYELLFRHEDVGVRTQALEADRQLLEQNRRRLELGFMTPIDVREAEVAVSADEEALLVAQNAYMESQFRLKRQIVSDSDTLNDTLFVPVGRLESTANPTEPRPDLFRTALSRRPDYRQAMKEIERENIRLRYARNQLWPQLDLVASYGANGIGSSFGNGYTELSSGKTTQWSVGLQATIPLGNVQARAQLNAVKAIKEQAILRLKQVEINVGIDIDTALSRIDTNRQRVATAATTVRLAEETVALARRRLEEGQISSFDVIDQQKRLFEARSRHLASIAEFNSAVVLLWRVTGIVLDKQEIAVAE